MKINFLGDSITEGAFAGVLEDRYSTLTAKHFGAEECNFGVSGTRIAKQVKRTNNPDDDVFMCRAMKMPTDAEFTFVFGGTNDYGHGDAKLGAFEDRDDYTFYGAFHNLVAYMVSSFSKDKLCFILPIPRFDQDNPYGDGSKDEPIAPMSAYVEAEKEVLAYYGVEYLDLSDKFYIPTTQQDDGNLYKDGLHPNAKGHRFLADCLIEYLTKKGLR
ncbi:MAG: SGNH/GDSL hydrolase family protein [Clostridia bacterium]|nr:SGNH/GDSL hydrolase family protein [Clostridia bacterium]